MKKYTYYIGRNISEGKVLIDTITHGTIVDYVTDRVQYATFYDTTGAWNGRKEQTTVVEFIGCPLHIAGPAMDTERFRVQLEKEFNQECVLLTVSNIETRH